jgi:arylsulfatase A-like enzyme
MAWLLVALGVPGIRCVGARENTRVDAARRRPSILLIMPDQMRGMDMGCMGNGEVRTPNLDRLASEGLLCRNTFANTPVCCPARAVILTGKYAHEHGLVANDLRLRETETTLAEILAAQGYHTGFIGKWHLDGGIRLPGFIPPGPRRQGFAFWAASECDHSHFRPVYFRDSNRPIVDHRFEPEVWTDRAIEFLDQVGDQPFFLEVAMGPPHDPYGAPDEYMRLYDPARLTMRPNWVEGVPGAGRKDLAAYYAAITAIDDQVGRLMKALEVRARAQDTIVVFISDHGNMMGSHGQRHKRKPWEESIRIPGIIRIPGKVQPGRSSNAIVTHVDLAPTLLSLCGVPVPVAMQGSDLSPIVLGKSDQGPEAAFLQIFTPFAGDGTPHPWRGVRTNRFLYARTQTGPWLLYDLEQDPYELKNLAQDPGAVSLRERMEMQLAACMKRYKDDWSADSMIPVEDNAQLYRFKTFYTIKEYQDWAAKHRDLVPGH